MLQIAKQHTMLKNEKYYKVLKYLWDDAFKFKRKEIFSSEITSLEKLISEFETLSIKLCHSPPSII